MISSLPSDLMGFILTGVHSIEQLEILLLLREDATKSWSVPQINAVIRSTEESISQRLELLLAQRLISVEQVQPRAFRYNPATPVLANLADRLVEAYNTQRAEITELIYNKPAGNIVGFANAFKLTKDDKNG